MKAIWLCEDEQARWFEFEEPFDMPDAVTVTKMVPERGPLTDEEIWDEVKAADLDWQTGWSLDEDASNRYITFARAIEAKLREKNTQPSKPLTDDQIMEMYNEPRSDAEMLEFARAIEAAHGIRATGETTKEGERG